MRTWRTGAAALVLTLSACSSAVSSDARPPPSTLPVLPQPSTSPPAPRSDLTLVAAPEPRVGVPVVVRVSGPAPVPGVLLIDAIDWGDGTMGAGNGTPSCAAFRDRPLVRGRLDRKVRHTYVSAGTFAVTARASVWCGTGAGVAQGSTTITVR